MRRACQRRSADNHLALVKIPTPLASVSGFCVFGARSSMQLDFDKMDGLIPAIVQDYKTNEVLMVGFVNQESYEATLRSGFVTFYSRTRKKLWMKGETSGNRLQVISAATDCDQDTLLFKVHVEGDGLVCHEGTVSCFTRPIEIATANASDEVRR